MAILGIGSRGLLPESEGPGRPRVHEGGTHVSRLCIPGLGPRPMGEVLHMSVSFPSSPSLAGALNILGR